MKPATESETMQIQLLNKPLLHQLFAIPDPETVQVIIKVHPFLPVQIGRQLVGGNTDIIGKMPDAVPCL